jgi:FKBP-type peptidyl-prolyl cis-trans isomerase FklB
MDLKTEKQKVSYSLGMDMGTWCRTQSIDLDTDVLLRGIRDGLSGSTPLMTNAEIKQTISAFQKGVQDRQREEATRQAEENRSSGEAFLAENRGKEGVRTLSSGLQYRVIEPGTGESPSVTDTVVVHYRGRLIDGKEFDSSYKRGEPAVFVPSQVIRGWQQALPLMKVGSKWEVYIPPDLAYGARRTGPDIRPYSTLIFEIELLDVR